MVSTVVIGNYTTPTINCIITWPDVIVPGILTTGAVYGKNVRLLPHSKLLAHFYSYFCALLGCTLQSPDTGAPLPIYAGNPSQYSAHKYMQLSPAEFMYFVDNVGLAEKSFGITEDDVEAFGKVLNETSGFRCSRSLAVAKGQVAASQAIFLGDGCPAKDEDGGECDRHEYWGSAAGLRALVMFL